MIISIKEKLFWLEKFYFFSIHGNDSKRFLNGLTTTNMNTIQSTCITCWLTPTGSLRSLLEIHEQSENFKILVLQGDVNELKKYFEQIIFPSDDVSLTEICQTYRIQEISNTKSWRDFPATLLSEQDKEKFYNQNKKEIKNDDNLKEWKINQGFPVFNKEIDGNTNPLELGLVDLIDFKKGCYLGQEKIARLKNAAPLKQEIRVWKSDKLINNFEIDDKKIYLNKNKEKIVGFISSYLEINSNEICGLAMIKKNYLNINSFYSVQFGNIRTLKSSASVFL